jgi:uncharacterized protein YbbK (DUF523 family)
MNKNIKRDKIAISACLLGIPCRYDGRCKLNKEAVGIFASNESVAICPEVLGGLAIPRPACEIIGGNGEDVLNSKAKVVDKDGNDYTDEFIEGARIAADMIKKLKIKKVYLKSKSPSCGATKMFDGSFTDKVIKGCGVFAALLEKENIELEEL